MAEDRRKTPTLRESATLAQAPVWAVLARELAERLTALEAERMTPGPGISIMASLRARLAAEEAQRYARAFAAWGVRPAPPEVRAEVSRAWVAFRGRADAILRSRGDAER